MIEEITGHWVPDEQMHPMMNIANRMWMTKDGEMFGTFRCYGDIPPEARARGLLWHLPATRPTASPSQEQEP